MTNPEFKTGDRIVVINTALFDRSITVGSLGEIVESKSPFEYGQYIVTIKFDKFEQIVSRAFAKNYIKHQELLQGLETYLEREWANYDKVVAHELKKFDVVIAEYQVRRTIGSVRQFYDKIAAMAVSNSLFKDFAMPSNINSQYGKLLPGYLQTLHGVNHDRT